MQNKTFFSNYICEKNEINNKHWSYVCAFNHNNK